tara:strand:+ start:190 stop:582 length:393 start_codon:yes stop_codon:yes gene_type:complete
MSVQDNTDKKSNKSDKLITLTKVDDAKSPLAYAQVIDENGNELSLAEVQSEDNKHLSLRAFIRGTSLDQFAGELNIVDENGKDEDLNFRNEVIAKMELVDKRFQFVKFFDTSTNEKTNMGFFFVVNNNTI